MRNVNPIAKKLKYLIETGAFSHEKLCVAADLKYPTYMNIFGRNIVSYATLKALKYAGIIDEKDEMQYNDWIKATNAIVKMKNCERVKKSRKKKKSILLDEPDNFTESEESDSGL